MCLVDFLSCNSKFSWNFYEEYFYVEKFLNMTDLINIIIIVRHTYFHVLANNISGILLLLFVSNIIIIGKRAPKKSWRRKFIREKSNHIYLKFKHISMFFHRVKHGLINNWIKCPFVKSLYNWVLWRVHRNKVANFKLKTPQLSLLFTNWKLHKCFIKKFLYNISKKR